MTDPQRLSLTRGVLVAGVLVLLTQAPYALTPGGASSDTWDDMPLWLAGIVAVAVVLVAALGLRVGLEILFLNRPADPAGIGLARPRRTVSSLALFAVLLVIVGPLSAVVTDLLGLLPDEEEVEAPDAYSIFMAAAAIVVAPWAEELSVRGVLLSGLWGRLGFWPAAVLSSVAWAGLHLQLGVIIMFGAAGVLLAWLRRRTGSILPGVAAHAAWNGVVTAVTFEAAVALPLLAAVLGSVVAAAVLMRRRPALIRRAVGGGVPPARRAAALPGAASPSSAGMPGTSPPALAGAAVRSRFAAPALMGIVNVTPDSFSDGGLLAGPGEAIAHGARLAVEGAALIDVGGESTRPGAAPVTVEEELRRVVPVVEGLVRATPAAVSVDTTKAEVARAAIAAGASFVNDISALRADPAMADVVREAAVPVCLMHMQGEPRTMQDDPRYDDVVEEVAAFLKARADEAIRRGIAAELICVDPGIGFGKTAEHNLLLLRHLDRIVALGYPVVVGASRKRFVGALTGVEEPSARVAGSVAAHVLALRAGAWMLRVHDVAAHREALAVAAAIGAPAAPPAAAAPAGETILVEVRGLEVFAHHGVHAHERRDGQPFLFDIELAAPARAAATDDLRDAVDYSAVCDRVAALATERSYSLIERLADVVARDLVERFGVAHARVRVRKPEAPLAHRFEHVAAVAERWRSPSDERSRSRSDEHSALLPGRQHARIVETDGRGTNPGGG